MDLEGSLRPKLFFHAIKTPEHPIYILGKNDYIGISSLQTGDRLLSSDGSIVTVESILARRLDITVYNFEVEDTHNYYVAAVDSSEPAVLVHNDRNCFVTSLPQRAKKISSNSRANEISNRFGFEDAHDLKRANLDGGENVAHWDIYHDTSTDTLYLVNKRDTSKVILVPDRPIN